MKLGKMPDMDLGRPGPPRALRLVDDAVVCVRDHAGLHVPLGLAGYGGTAAVLLTAGAVAGPLAVAVLAAPALVVVLVTAAAGVTCSLPDRSTRSTSALGAVRRVGRQLPALVVFTILAVLLLALSVLGFVVLVVPTAAAVAIGFAALVLERAAPAAAVRRGLVVSRLHRGRLVRAFVAALVVALAVGAIGAQAGVVVAALGDGGTAAAVLVLAPLIVAVAGFGLPVLVALATVSYLDCRVRNEALDLFLDLDALPAVS